MSREQGASGGARAPLREWGNRQIVWEVTLPMKADEKETCSEYSMCVTTKSVRKVIN